MTDRIFMLVNGAANGALDWPLVQRGLLYGDGFFTSLLATHGHILMAAGHWQRIHNSCQALGLELPWPSPAEMERALAPLLTHAPWLRLRVCCWRQAGGRYKPEGRQTHWLAEAEDLPNTYSLLRPTAQRPGILPEPNLLPSRWSFIKSLSSQVYVQAARLAEEGELDDYLLLNHRGEIADARAGNLFLLINGCWYTTPDDCGGINGVMQRHLIDYQSQIGVCVKQLALQPAAVELAKSVFTCNAAGITPWFQTPQGRALDLAPAMALAARLTAQLLPVAGLAPAPPH